MGTRDAETLPVRPAAEAEAELLSGIAIRSKAHWGYSAEFMAACRHELVVSASEIADPDRIYLVCETKESVIGYVALVRIDPGVWEVDALFVEPAHIGQGYGRKLMERAIAAVKTRSACKVLIQSDPYAADFYAAFGCTRVGEKESGSIPGRFLPMFEIRFQA
ncbi:MAG: GNAT family N-acetyltransferase [Pseudomonadota bacterium]